MNKIVVYLDEYYIEADEFITNLDDKEDIIKEVDERYPLWYYYDIWKCDEGGI